MTGHNVGSLAAPVKIINLNGGSVTNAARIVGQTINLNSAATVSGSPTYVLPASGALNATSPLTLSSGTTVQGGGASAATVTGDVTANSGSVVAVGADPAVAGTLTFNNNLTLNNG